jgi:hypothetical protein
VDRQVPVERDCEQDPQPLTKGGAERVAHFPRVGCQAGQAEREARKSASNIGSQAAGNVSDVIKADARECPTGRANRERQGETEPFR